MKTNNKWTVKDVITTVLLTVLLIGIHFVVITVSMVNQLKEPHTSEVRF